MPQRPQDAWKGNAPAGRPVRSPRPTPGRRWFGAALLLLALAGLIAGLFYYIRPDPDPVLLALPVAQYGPRTGPPTRGPRPTPGPSPSGSARTPTGRSRTRRRPASS